MSYYARQDTHFLLHIYALLRDELHDAAVASRNVGDVDSSAAHDTDDRLVREVLKRSQRVSLIRCVALRCASKGPRSDAPEPRR